MVFVLRERETPLFFPTETVCVNDSSIDTQKP